MRTEHPIQQAASLAGLSPHTIRAWERRYAALTPQRTESNRRLYSDSDIARLVLLRKGVEAGYSIGRIAAYSSEELRGLVAAASLPAGIDAAPRALTPDALLEEGMEAVGRLDAGALENVFLRAASCLGTAAMIDSVTIPFLNRLGEGWREGSVRIANEHMASTVLRAHLLRTLGAVQPQPPAPCLVVTTPAGQHHEFGALLTAVSAALLGWRVLYLGTNLPAEEIAGAVLRAGAVAVALSIVYPPDDPGLAQELVTLRKSLGDDLPILVGGRYSSAYRDALSAIAAVTPGDLRSLHSVLENIRSR